MLVEVNCESDFVARTDDFQELVRDLAMHIAAADPQFIRKEDVTDSRARRRKKTSRKPAPSPKASLKRSPTKSWKAAWPSSTKRFACYEQPFVKENTITIDQLIKTKIAKLGENISVSRFARFKVGDTANRMLTGNDRRAFGACLFSKWPNTNASS